MKDILNSHPVSVLKKEISKSNIKGYSKMKKAEIVALMLKHKDKFSHIKMAEKKEKKKKPFMTATKASGEVVELKERKPKKKAEPKKIVELKKKEAKKEEKQKKKEADTKDRLRRALELWEENKSKFLGKDGNPTPAYQRLKQRMNLAKNSDQINKKIDQFSQLIKKNI